MKEKNEGITIISLVITVIVMIIISGISIQVIPDTVNRLKNIKEQYAKIEEEKEQKIKEVEESKIELAQKNSVISVTKSNAKVNIKSNNLNMSNTTTTMQTTNESEVKGQEAVTEKVTIKTQTLKNEMTTVNADANIDAKYVNAIKLSNEKPSDEIKSTARQLSAEPEIYMWVQNNTIYWWGDNCTPALSRRLYTFI